MTKWITGYNMPGYLPDNPQSDVAEFDTWGEARDDIQNRLENIAEGFDWEEQSHPTREQRQARGASNELEPSINSLYKPTDSTLDYAIPGEPWCSGMVGQYVYWIMEVR